MGSGVNFQPNQIVCLEHEGTRLYAEVIQIVESRQMCWVRPLMLVVSSSDDYIQSDRSLFYDLRHDVDLVWPAVLFRSALDTEVIPLITHLMASKTQTESTNLAHQQLQIFIRQVWQAYQSNF